MEVADQNQREGGRILAQSSPLKTVKAARHKNGTNKVFSENNAFCVNSQSIYMRALLHVAHSLRDQKTHHQCVVTMTVKC